MTVENNTNKYTENESEFGDFKFLVFTDDGLRSVVYVDKSCPSPDESYIIIPTGDSLYGLAAFCLYYSIGPAADVLIINSVEEYVERMGDNDGITFDN
jgi:hypothetical protein